MRDIHEVLTRRRGTTYGTALNLLRIMHRKGLATREDAQRPHTYSASVPEEQMQVRLVTDFVDRVFRGSARKLVAALLRRGVSGEELEDIKRVVGQAISRRR